MEMKEFIESLPIKKVPYTQVLLAMSEINKYKQPKNVEKTKVQNPKHCKKRVSIPWTKEEVDAIEDGVKKYGIGHWTLVYDLHRDIFMKNERRSSDIGDKWKNMKTKAQYQKYLQPEKQPFVPPVINIQSTEITSTAENTTNEAIDIQPSSIDEIHQPNS